MASLDQLDASLARASRRPASVDEVALVAAIYRRLATGTAASPEALAAELALDGTFVEQRLGTWPGVFRGTDGSVVGFWGLALTDMPHRIRFVGAAEVRAWCAWDPMFIVPIVGRATVQTHDPVSGQPISYQIGPDGLHGTSDDQVVSFLEPGDAWEQDVITSFCHYVLHFTDRETGASWVAEHPGTFLLPVQDAAELGRRHAHRLTTTSGTTQP